MQKLSRAENSCCFYQQPFATGSELYARGADCVACHHDRNCVLELDREGANWYTYGDEDVRYAVGWVEVVEHCEVEL